MDSDIDCTVPTVSTTFSTLPQTMLTMLADPALSDVYLVVEDIDVPAHKAVLGERYEFCQGRNHILWSMK